MTDVVAERRPGRPRSVAADEAILDAATDAFIELGWDGLTIEGVAARAGVGKTTIYRRYPCRLDLLLAAAERLAEEKGAAPDTGSLRGDLLGLADAYLGMLTTPRPAGRSPRWSRRPRGTPSSRPRTGRSSPSAAPKLRGADRAGAIGGARSRSRSTRI